VECLVPKLDIQVFGTGGSRRAGEQAAAKLALEAVQNALLKSTGTARKARPRASQLKLAGIATIQTEVSNTPNTPNTSGDGTSRKSGKTSVKAEPKTDTRAEAIENAPDLSQTRLDLNPASDTDDSAVEKPMSPDDKGVSSPPSQTKTA
jgi:ribonuclease-3